MKGKRKEKVERERERETSLAYCTNIYCYSDIYSYAKVSYPTIFFKTPKRSYLGIEAIPKDQYL